MQFKSLRRHCEDEYHQFVIKMGRLRNLDQYLMLSTYCKTTFLDA